MKNRIKLTRDPIHPEKILSQIKCIDNGAIVSFIGTVRKYSNRGIRVTRLKIDPAAEDAEKKLIDIANEASRKWPIKTEDITVRRRIGTLAIGEVALVVAVASIHRQEAFAACEYIVDRIKQGGITLEEDILVSE